jgi:hypothetical protein
MPRISGIEPQQASLFTRFVYWMTKRKIGRVVVPIKITAHQTRLLRGYGEMEMAQAAMHTIPKTLNALASIKAATLIGCPF